METIETNAPTNTAARETSLITDRVTEGIRTLILSGELPPGSRIGQEELAARFAVSRIPSNGQGYHVHLAWRCDQGVFSPNTRCIMTLPDKIVARLKERSFPNLPPCLTENVSRWAAIAACISKPPCRLYPNGGHLESGPGKIQQSATVIMQNFDYVFYRLRAQLASASA